MGFTDQRHLVRGEDGPYLLPPDVRELGTTYDHMTVSGASRSATLAGS